MVERREFFEPEPEDYPFDDEERHLRFNPDLDAPGLFFKNRHKSNYFECSKKKLLTFDDFKESIDKKYEMNKEVAFDYIQDLEMQMKR